MFVCVSLKNINSLRSAQQTGELAAENNKACYAESRAKSSRYYASSSKYSHSHSVMSLSSTQTNCVSFLTVGAEITHTHTWMKGALNYACLDRSLEIGFRHTLHTMMLTILECQRYHGEVVRAHLVVENPNRASL